VVKQSVINKIIQQGEMQNLLHIFSSTNSVNFLTEHPNAYFLPVVMIKDEEAQSYNPSSITIILLLTFLQES